MFITRNMTVLGGRGFSIGGGGEELKTASGYPLTLTKTLAKLPESITVYGNTGGVGEQEIPLPSGYTALKYIESTGTQYIDTGVVPNQDTKVELDFRLLSGAGALFGSRSGAQSNGFALQALSSGKFGGTYGNANRGGESMYDYHRHIHVLDRNVFYLDGNINITYPTATFSCPGNACIFTMYNNASVLSSGVVGRLYRCTMYDNGTLIKDFVPTKRNSDDAVGVYDVRNNTFYPNSGTGAFIAGDEAAYRIPILLSDGTANKTINLYSDVALGASDNLVVNPKTHEATKHDDTSVADLQDWLQDWKLPKSDSLTVSAGTTVAPSSMEIEYWSSEKG